MNFLPLVFVLVSATAKQLPVSKNFKAGSIEFIGEFYKELLKYESGNFLTCPLSLQMAIGLLNSGAKGNTAKQITTSLHFPEEKENIEASFLKLTETLENHDKSYILTSANKIYLANNLAISEHYNKTVQNVFYSEIENIDFGNTAQAVSEINSWVEDKTNHKIKNLITEGAVDESTTAVFLNAIYFQGKWRTPFSQALFPSLFYLNKDNTTYTDMMEVEDQFNYYESSELKASFLEMPYICEDISMTIVLPTTTEGLSFLETRISEVIVAPKYKFTTLKVIMPKFKIETTINLIPVLQALGITDAFNNHADFSGISPNAKFFISEGIQKAFIEVDEKGTTAAAATGFYDIRISEPEFLVNHPFLFYLKHKGSIIFIGRYSNPSSSSSIDAKNTSPIPSRINPDNAVVINHESIDASRVWVN